MPTKKITEPKDLNSLTITAGMDIGNGDSKIKLSINDQPTTSFSLPSAVAYTTGANTPKVPTKDYMNNLYNNLDAEVTGPGVKPNDEGRVFFGQRAVESGQSLTMFNINDHVPKSEDSLSTILIDGILAASAITEYFNKNNKLPDHLNIIAGIGTALPIADYLDYRDQYKQTLMSGIHTVTVRNFKEPIQVKIKFQAVTVMAEGAAAQYAIRKLGAKFIQLAIDNARKNGSNIDPAYTGEMLADATNSIGLDLGDGTVNIAVITNKRMNIEASRTLNKSYGTVLDGAVEDLINTNASFDNRRDLSAFMLDKNNQKMPAQKSTYQQAQRAIDRHKKILARDIQQIFASVFRKVGKATQVIWVYGGGATPMQNDLEPIMTQATKVGEDQNIPVLWMDSSYSRNLNRNGLYDAAIYGVQASLQ